jgi:aminopeptidase N
MRKYIFLSLLLVCFKGFSQTTDTTKTEPWRKIYRATTTKINDLVHTKLDVRFDYNKSWMYGKAWITLHPHFYPTDSLNLDAKGMTINEVSIVKGGKNIKLKYSYDSSNLFITLDKTYKASEQYIIYINYISRPDERPLPAFSIAGSKGLYFINPKGADKNKSIQIWTQGESEFNSAWFPTIDKPNQKTTEEISMTVPAKYVTMSNGLMVNQKTNGDGTRTDTWKMNEPNAPYLFFMGVGDYSITKDKYKNKEVNYYVEKQYASVARKIFGLTPEMIALYSRLTGVDYPWEKYVQIVGKDDESFSMENTSTTLHGEFIEADARELVDGNPQEQTIAHELFHQWFGDYVTCESWSNITLNESFADYGETLWNEYKYGKDEGDATIGSNLRAYLGDPGNANIPLVHFYYADKDDVFDNVSYPKGGCILHMLRNYVGDSAFFKSLNFYLTKHKYSNAEAQDLRLAFEEVTGKDLNWFFNEWYYGKGHPKLEINYAYDASSKAVKVFMKQTQTGNIFKLPFAIDVYEGGSKKRYNVWMNDGSDTFSFAANSKPDLVNVDGDKILLCEKTDNKTLDAFIFQYKNAGLHGDRREAINFASKFQTDKKALEFLKIALNDKSERLRRFTLSKLNADNDTVKTAVEMIVKDLAIKDPKPLVRADAIDFLGKYKKNEYKPLFIKALNDSSYTISGNALKALSKIDDAAAEAEAKKLSLLPAKGTLKEVLNGYVDESKFDSIATVFDKLPSLSNSKFNMLSSFGNFLGRVKNTNNLKRGIDMIVKFRDTIPQQFRGNTDPFINGILKEIAEKKTSAGLKEQADYIQSKIPASKREQ